MEFFLRYKGMRTQWGSIQTKNLHQKMKVSCYKEIDLVRLN